MTSSATLLDLLRDHPIGGSAALLTQGSRTASRAGLLDSATEVAAALQAVGVQPGHAVAAVVEDGFAAVAHMFGVWAADAVYLPVNGRHAPREVGDHLAEVEPAAVVGSFESLDRFGLGGDGSRTVAATGAAVRGCSPSARRFDPDVALAVRTSGTTGDPQTVLLQHSRTLQAIDAALDRIRGARRQHTEGREAFANLIPLSLALWAGTFNTLFSLRAGASVVLMGRFEPREFAGLVARYRVRSTALVPGMIMMLTECDEVTDLSPLRFVRSITAPLLPDAARRFRARFGVDVLNSYGQTELGGEVVGWTAADLREFGDRKLGSVGRPYPHIGLRIVDAGGRQVPVGEPGEICVSSPFLMQSYADRALGLDGRLVDGYLRTGDLGRVDESGFLWIDGRVSDVINRGGLKVHPAEVEEALRRHADITDACVAGVPDERLGEVPFAWVRTRADVTPASLSAHCRSELAPYKVPVDFAVVDDFPRNETGKVLRRALVAEYLR